jgi:hypothetical protein
MTELYTTALEVRELKPLADLKQEPQIIDRLEQKIIHHNQPYTRIKPTRPRKRRQ